MVGHPRAGRPHLVSVRDAAVQTDFYRDWTAADPDDQVLVERFLAQDVESRAAHLLRDAAGGELPRRVEALTPLMRFLAFQIVRTPRFRRLDRDIGGHLFPILLANEVVHRVTREAP